MNQQTQLGRRPEYIQVRNVPKHRHLFFFFFFSQLFFLSSEVCCRKQESQSILYICFFVFIISFLLLYSIVNCQQWCNVAFQRLTCFFSFVTIIIGSFNYFPSMCAQECDQIYVAFFILSFSDIFFLEKSGLRWNIAFSSRFTNTINLLLFNRMRSFDRSRSCGKSQKKHTISE